MSKRELTIKEKVRIAFERGLKVNVTWGIPPRPKTQAAAYVKSYSCQGFTIKIDDPIQGRSLFAPHYEDVEELQLAGRWVEIDADKGRLFKWSDAWNDSALDEPAEPNQDIASEQRTKRMGKHTTGTWTYIFLANPGTTYPKECDAYGKWAIYISEGNVDIGIVERKADAKAICKAMNNV
jgi:hypothetical protein